MKHLLVTTAPRKLKKALATRNDINCVIIPNNMVLWTEYHKSIVEGYDLLRVLKVHDMVLVVLPSEQVYGGEKMIKDAIKNHII